MPELTTLLLFSGAALLLIIAPGPDIIFLISQGLSRGRRAGVETACGLAAGNLVHTLGAVAGVSVIFRTSALAFTVLKLAGAAWLVYLALKTLREKPGERELPDAQPDPQGSLLLRGFLMNILNPKVALFFLAFLPQFANPESGPVWLQMMIFGLLFTLLVVLVFGAIGFFSGFFNHWLGRAGGSRIRTLLSRSVAAVYLLLAARLVLTEQ